MEEKELIRLAREYAEDLEEHVRDGRLDEYLEDILDLKFIVDNRGEIDGVRIAVTTGGPNIYINTYRSRVEVYWSGEGYCYIDNDVADAVTDYFREIYSFVA